ncbi:MAG: Brp/Blh family beta-carotene 15,15'-dioxygenase [Pseudomonadota bacterium]
MSKKLNLNWHYHRFIAIALTLSILLLNYFLSFSHTASLIFLTLLIISAIPHGAYDWIEAKHRFVNFFSKGFVWFLLIYLLLGLSFILLWLVAPLFVLITMLFISAYHFGLDDNLSATKNWRSNSIYFMREITFFNLVILTHEKVIVTLFAQLVGENKFATIQAFLINWHLPMLIITLSFIVIVFYSQRKNKYHLLEYALLLSLFATLNPLLSFATYFAIWHAPRHLLKATTQYPPKKGQMIIILLVSVVTCLSAGLIFMLLTNVVSLEIAWLRTLFVGLFALTVPHMLWRYCV